MRSEPIFECPLEDLSSPDARGFEWQDDDRARLGFVVRKGDQAFGYRNVCPHAGNPLHWKPHAFLTRSRDLIMCSVHGATFEIDTGVCVGGPCPGRTLSPLRTEIRQGRVVVYPD